MGRHENATPFGIDDKLRLPTQYIRLSFELIRESFTKYEKLFAMIAHVGEWNSKRKLKKFDSF